MRRLEAAGRPATSVAHALSVASSFYRYAISLEATEYNPFKDLDRPRVDPDHSPTVTTKGRGRQEDARSRRPPRDACSDTYLAGPRRRPAVHHQQRRAEWERPV